MNEIATTQQTERILDAQVKGLSLRQIAEKEGLTVHGVRSVTKSPAILRAVAQHRTKYAVMAYESACAITEIIAGTIPALKERDLSGDSRFLRDLAWVAKAQFDQSNAILSNLIKNADSTGDSELDEAAKMLAARVLRKEAEKVDEFSDAITVDSTSEPQ